MRRRGNVVGHAPAWREMDAGASRLHSHAGAWGGAVICPPDQTKEYVFKRITDYVDLETIKTLRDI